MSCRGFFVKGDGRAFVSGNAVKAQPYGFLRWPVCFWTRLARTGASRQMRSQNPSAV
jgi:hypothetical protein